jgi:hypothetical protein
MAIPTRKGATKTLKMVIKKFLFSFDQFAPTPNPIQNIIIKTVSAVMAAPFQSWQMNHGNHGTYHD